MIKILLWNVIRCINEFRNSKTIVSDGFLIRRKGLHQLMFVNQDYECVAGEGLDEKRGLM